MDETLEMQAEKPDILGQVSKADGALVQVEDAVDVLHEASVKSTSVKAANESQSYKLTHHQGARCCRRDQCQHQRESQRKCSRHWRSVRG